MWDQSLIKKYDVPGPRYTSYPTAISFTDEFDPQDFFTACAKGSTDEPLSLYLHIPFCEQLCYYCACNKIVSKNKDKAIRYVDAMIKEMDQYTETLGKRPITQLHLGGGTPTFLPHEEMQRLMSAITERFNLTNEEHREYAIEVDPRTIDEGYLPLLKDLGFNRISFGIQDFGEKVQIAINRMQSVELCQKIVDEARELGFESISFDLVYGLPEQTMSSFEHTVASVIELDPDRIALFNYAHLPSMFKAQRLLDPLPRPAADEKLAMMLFASEKLSNAGYQFIGLDHFVKPGDELAVAAKDGSIQRNFQGYSVQKAKDLIGLGLSSISSIHGVYAQNQKTLKEYYAAIESNCSPVIKGYSLSDDDEFRRFVIMSLATHMSFSFAEFEKLFKQNAKHYFKQEFENLQGFVDDQVLKIDNEGIHIYEAGRPIIRNVCMVFDQYLNEKSRQRYSRTI